MSTETKAPVQATKVITGLVRLSYVHVFEPASVNDNDEKKYSVSVIIPKTDTETIDKIKAAIKEAAEQGKAKLGGKVPANLKTPLRDGDVDRPEDEAYAGSYFINATSKTKPGVVDRFKNEIPATHADELYSGCYGRVSINFYAFNANGNKGVAAGLNNIQKIKDGEALGGGRMKAEDEFNDDFKIEDQEDDF